MFAHDCHTKTIQSVLMPSSADLEAAEREQYQDIIHPYQLLRDVTLILREETTLATR